MCRSPCRPEARPAPAAGKKLGEHHERGVPGDAGKLRSVGTQKGISPGNPLGAGPCCHFIPQTRSRSSPEWELRDKHLTTGLACLLLTRPITRGLTPKARPMSPLGEGSPHEAGVGFGVSSQAPPLCCSPGGLPCRGEPPLIKSSARRGLMVNRLFMEGYKQPVRLFNTFR